MGELYAAYFRNRDSWGRNIRESPITNVWACDDDRYPCPIRSEALIEETVQAPDQLAPDQQQEKSAQPQKKAKQPAPTNEKAHAKRDREAPRTTASAKVSKPAVREQASDAEPQKAVETVPAVVASPRAAASNAVQFVDPNEVNELDRAASVESSK
jgi:hypothetical protein